MQTKINIIVNKVYKNPWFKAVLCAIVCLFVYFVRKCIYISENGLTLINMGIGIFLLIAIYQIVREKNVPLIRIFLLLLSGFIVNQLYIPDEFYKKFHVKLQDACIVTCVIIVCCIVFPSIIKGLWKVLMFVESIVICWIEIDKESRQKREESKLERKKQQEKKREKTTDIILKKNIVEKEIHDINKETIMINSEGFSKMETKETKEALEGIEDNPKKRNIMTKGERFLFIFLLIVIVVIPIIFIWYSLDKDLFSTLNSVDTFGVINILVLLMSLVASGIIICAVVLGVIFKLAHTLVDIITQRSKRSYYLIYTGVFLLISVYISKQYGYTIDDVSNILITGDIFSFPLIMVIVLPVFLTFLDSFQKYLEKEIHFKEEIVELIRGMAFDIVKSLLKYVRFVTADFLASIEEIVEEDIDNEQRK